jgi:hypothetical protein
MIAKFADTRLGGVGKNLAKQLDVGQLPMS